MDFSISVENQSKGDLDTRISERKKIQWQKIYEIKDYSKIMKKVKKQGKNLHS